MHAHEHEYCFRIVKVLKHSCVDSFNSLVCLSFRPNTLKFIDVLPALVQGYNANLHRSIGMAPQEVTSQNELQV